MKVNLKYAILLNLPLLVNFLHADIDLDQEDIGSEQIQQVAKRTPYGFETHIDAVSPAKIKNKKLKGHHITFREADVNGGSVVYYDEDRSEAVRMSLSYVATYIQFDDNPWFHQDHWETLSFNLAGVTKRIDDWFWRTQLSVNVDTHEWTAPYINYDLLLWGRYTFCKNVGLHVGFWAQTGMLMDRVYPIIGADWQISKKWKLNLVYPVNVSLQYAINKTWGLAIGGRSFDSRHRVHKKASKSRDLVHYKNIGAEFMVMYESAGMTANIHAGMTLGGRYRIATKNNHHAINYRLESAGYAGGEIDVSF